ncbi:MAG: hypothetical protein KAI40_02330 [Desulfobacterales bacterium]|nr:hypothetical protein [Desulfobacterales bacterium]
MANKIDDIMKQKIDTVLDTVKEPESGLSVGQIGLVQKFRYVSSKKILYVYRNPILPSKGCCTIMSIFVNTAFGGINARAVDH